jgi:hypothetical protein
MKYTDVIACCQSRLAALDTDTCRGGVRGCESSEEALMPNLARKIEHTQRETEQ